MTVSCENCNLFALPAEKGILNRTNRPGGIELTKKGLDLCDFPRHARILDIACGLGATLNYLNTRFNSNAIGLDRSRKILFSALENLPGLNLIMGDSQCLPLATGSMNGVLMECALSLSYNSLETLREIRRILLPGGKAVITDIYLREMNDLNNMKLLTSNCCVSGAMNREKIYQQLEAVGFKIELWEDQTILLKNWMAENIFKMGSAFEFFRNFTGGSNDRELVNSFSRKVKLGYFLTILRNES